MAPQRTTDHPTLAEEHPDHRNRHEHIIRKYDRFGARNYPEKKIKPAALARGLKIIEDFAWHFRRAVLSRQTSRILNVFVVKLRLNPSPATKPLSFLSTTYSGFAREAKEWIFTHALKR